MPRTPSLDALRIFAVAARHLSFTEAAAELNLTQSAVSHRIRGLEEELGLNLFNRLTRRLELTPQGRLLAQRVDRAIGEIDRSIVDLWKTEDDSPLKVTMLPSVASHWLIPRLARVRQRHPNVDVQVIADPRLLDLRAEGIDLAIRFGRAPHASYHATRLMGDRVIPVCSPDLLQQHGSIETVDALLAMPLLHDSATEGDGSGSDWQAWLTYCGMPNLVCQAGQHFSEASMLINAAMLGLGVALARVSLVADHIAGGALVCPLSMPAPTVFSYHLLGLPEHAETTKIATFRSLLVAEAARTEAFMQSIGVPQPIAA
jgi:LysR family glycine cleavage system transcriptional activator